MIVSPDSRPPAPRWLRAATWVAVLCALPFGLIYCDRPSTPTEGEEETAPGAEALETADQTFDGDLADILTRREEDIHRKIRERVKAGDLDEHAGRVLSAYVSGAKAGILARHMDRSLSVEEKRRAAEELTESAEWDGLDSRATLEKARTLILEQAASDLDAALQREQEARMARLREVFRPPMPIIEWRLYDTLPVPDTGGAARDRRNLVVPDPRHDRPTLTLVGLD